MTYTSGLLLLLFVVLTSEAVPVWKTVVIAALAIDIGGGVVSNFTKATINYYRESTISPYAFLWLHSLQAAVLAGIFWEHRTVISVVAFLMLASSSIVITVSGTQFRRQTGAFVFALWAMALSFSLLPLPPFVLLLLLGLKLMLGYASNWKNVRD